MINMFEEMPVDFLINFANYLLGLYKQRFRRILDWAMLGVKGIRLSRFEPFRHEGLQSDRIG